MVIRGDGVAAYCCAYLLGKAGLEVRLEPVDRPRLPAIMLSDHALALIRDIFDRPDLFREAHRILKRMVAWGPDSTPLALDHSAVVVSEEQLFGELRPGVALQESDVDKSGWTVFASRPLPALAEEHPFGSRMASATTVSLQDGSMTATCWIESLENGWLFLIPNAPESAWLLAVGSSPDALLDESRVIREQIKQTHAGNARAFPAYPRIVAPLCGDRWLACGTAAMAFDPLCGDGTAHAVREAILASAVIRAVSGDGPHDSILAHYEARLTAGFRRHLELCREFYTSGGGPWWRRELELIQQGMAWCDNRLSLHGEFRYQLRDFELHALR